MNNRYSFSEALSTGVSLVITRLFFPGARLIRRPVYLRGKKSLKYGKGFTTGHACRFDLPGDKKTLEIGDNCQIGDNVHIVAHNKVVIGNNVLMASKIFISDTNHGCYKGNNQSSPIQPPNERELSTDAVVIEDNVWIGENVVILPGVTVGEGSVIGANTVVTHDVKRKCMVAGCPASIIKKWEEQKQEWERIDNAY